MLSMERASWVQSLYLPVLSLWEGADTLTTASLSSLPRRVDQNGTPMTPTVPLGLEDHPASALSYRGFLGTPVGRYGFPRFGRGDTPVPPPTLFSGERRVYNSFICDPMISARLGLGTVVRAVGIRIGFRTPPTHEGLILTQYFPHHRISRISVARLEVSLSLI